ncbi:MAG TPA: hypothetical protein VFE31_14730 [Opitutaceae bacterium]|jgi:hypothetical protein|nr:hypothetical protein [Opitutaceae bacterium]
MSNPAIPAPSAALSATPSATAAAANRALLIGLGGILVTWLGAFVSGPRVVGTAWLVGEGFWTAAAIGFLMLTMLLHIFDAMWGTVLRRQLEHGLVAFKWLALLFVPMLLVAVFRPHNPVWVWMDLSHRMVAEHTTVGNDIIYWRKSSLLNFRAFVIFTAVLFVFWIWVASRLRRASIAQDSDGDPKWTVKNRFTSGFGLPLGGLALTAAAILWFKSLEYHWFSTMYGVWYFADCMRCALSFGVLIMFWLWHRGDYQGVLNRNHWHSIGQLMLAFTVFWGYICFSQYFLTWNANVPEETFWFNEREFGDWYAIGMVLVFGNFLLPFLLLLSYRFKITKHIIRRIAIWILLTTFIDLCWNILPALKDANGNARPFLSLTLVWAITSTIGIGGICIWAYLRALPATKLIPIRDPRITETLTFHEDE